MIFSKERLSVRWLNGGRAASQRNPFAVRNILRREKGGGAMAHSRRWEIVFSHLSERRSLMFLLQRRSGRARSHLSNLELTARLSRNHRRGEIRLAMHATGWGTLPYSIKRTAISFLWITRCDIGDKLTCEAIYGNTCQMLSLRSVAKQFIHLRRAGLRLLSSGGSLLICRILCSASR